MRRLSIASFSAMLAITLSLAVANCRRSSRQATPQPPQAEVDCDAVVRELRQTKAADKVAADMKTTTSDVFRCLRQVNKAEIERQTRERAAGASAASHEASSSTSTP